MGESVRLYKSMHGRGHLRTKHARGAKNADTSVSPAKGKQRPGAAHAAKGSLKSAERAGKFGNVENA